MAQFQHGQFLHPKYGRNIRNAVRGCIYGLTAVCAAAIAPAQAQSPEAFYKGKTISILMGTGPGGSYDLYGRLMANHLGRHIPGHPVIIIEHMPGAGGANAGNFIYGPAPQDGSKILLTHALPLIEKLSGSSGIRFKSEKFQWIGAYDEIAQILTLWNNAPARNFAQLKTKGDVVVGSMGRSHLSFQWASLLKESINAPYRVIAGYTSGSSLNLAMERGEIHGWVVAWESLAGTKPDWLRDNKVNMLVQFTLERHRELPNVPTLLELMPPENRDVAALLLAGTPIARALAYGPGVPADRVAAVRAAFDAAMKDKALIAEAEKRKLALKYRSAAQTLALVEQITSASPELIARTKKAVGQQ